MTTIVPTQESRIENDANQEDLQRQLKQVGLRRDICRCLLRTHGLRPGLAATATTIVRMLEIDYAAVWTFVENGENLQRRASAGQFADSFDCELASRLPVSDSTLIGSVAALQAPILVDDVSMPMDCIDSRPPDAAIWSFVGIPLTTDGRCCGVLSAYHRTAFSVDVRRMLNAAADELGRHYRSMQEVEELRAQDHLRRVVIQSSPVSIVNLDAEQRVIAWNPAARTMFGWPSDQITGQRIPFIAASSRPLFEDTLRQSFSGRTASPMEMTGRRWDGREFEIAVAAFPLMNDDGAAEQSVLFVTDRREQSILQQRLNAHLTVADTVTDANSIRHTAPRLIQSLCKNFRWTYGEYWQVDESGGNWNCIAQCGDSARNAGSPPGSCGNDAATQVLLENVKSTRAPYWKPNVVISGRSLQTAKRVSNLHDALAVPVRSGANVVGVMAFYNVDIPEPDDRFLATLTAIADQASDLIERERAAASLQQLEENLRQSQKMEAIGLLAGGIAHDFNNLLTVILGHSEIALEHLDETSALCPLIKEVEEAGRRAAALTRQLLTFSRKQVLEPKVLDLNAHVRDMDRMLRRLIGEDIVWQTALSPHLHLVKADSAQMEQILLNLAVNARDAMPEGGRFAIETRNFVISRPAARSHPELEAGDYVGLTVSDTGCGMDENTRRRIFEPFFTTKPRDKGTGMGLSTVYGIVRQSGGTITVKSQPGHGTSFTILLPRVCNVLLPIEADVQPIDAGPGTETILLAEDEDPVRALVASVLTARGYTVLQATNGAEAIEILREQGKKIDLLLSDVIMPGMNGPQSATRMRQIEPQLRVMFMSGYTDSEALVRDMANSKCLMLQKPFTSNDLAAKVRDALN